MNKFVGNVYKDLDKKPVAETNGACIINLCGGDTSSSCSGNFCWSNDYSGCWCFACGVKGEE